MLPADFPIDTFDTMTTVQQLKAVQRSGLSREDQWLLLNAESSLKTVAELMDIQNNRSKYGLSNTQADQLCQELLKIDNARMDVQKGNNPFVSSRDQRMFFKMLEERETNLLSSLTQSNSTQSDIESDHNLYDALLPTPGPAPEMTPGPHEKTPMEMIEPKPTPRPDNISDPLASYQWYENMDALMNTWANENLPLARDTERCASIYKRVFADGKEYYTVGATKQGQKDNVILPFIYQYLFENVPQSSRVGFTHTHPQPPQGYRSDFASQPDLFLLKLPGIDVVYVVPYENVNKKGAALYLPYP